MAVIQINTVQLTEIIWTSICAIGLVFCVMNLAQAISNYRSGKRLQLQNGRMIWAAKSMRSTIKDVIMEMIFVLIGVVAMTIPRNPGSSSTISWVFAGLFIFVSAIITLDAIDWRLQTRKMQNSPPRR